MLTKKKDNQHPNLLFLLLNIHLRYSAPLPSLTTFLFIWNKCMEIILSGGSVVLSLEIYLFINKRLTMSLTSQQAFMILM